MLFRSEAPAMSGSSVGNTAMAVTPFNTAAGSDLEADFCGGVQATNHANRPNEKAALATDETQMKHRWDFPSWCF